MSKSIIERVKYISRKQISEIDRDQIEPMEFRLLYGLTVY